MYALGERASTHETITLVVASSSSSGSAWRRPVYRPGRIALLSPKMGDHPSETMRNHSLLSDGEVVPYGCEVGARIAEGCD
jgi:hypothetical protein